MLFPHPHGILFIASLSLCYSACTGGCCCSILLCREHERLVATTCSSLSLVQSFCLALYGQWIGLHRHHRRNMPTGLLSLFTCGCEVFFESMGYLAYRLGFGGTGNPVTDLEWVSFHCVALLGLLLRCLLLCCMWCDFCCCYSVLLICVYGGTGSLFISDLEWISCTM